MAELWGIAEIAAHYGVTPQRANEWARSARFPEPAHRLAAGRIWKANDVRAWAEHYRPDLRKD